MPTNQPVLFYLFLLEHNIEFLPNSPPREAQADSLLHSLSRSSAVSSLNCFCTQQCYSAQFRISDKQPHKRPKV